MRPHEPHEWLRDWLEWYRERGWSFEGAWIESVGRACGSARASEAAWWRAIFEEQRDTWERAYDREEPMAGDAALVLLAEGRLPVDRDARLLCAHCDGPIPPERLKHKADFCCEECRLHASRARERKRLAAA